MKIEVKNVYGYYSDVTVVCDNETIRDSVSDSEANDFAEMLINAAWDICPKGVIDPHAWISERLRSVGIEYVEEGAE